MNKIIKNSSEGYGYNYASLADFARQDVPIPPMRTVVDEFGEFVEYYDAKSEQWHRGARVVPLSMKGMNEAQAYGSALTYARRYTVALANGIATDDDDNIERAKPVSSRPPQQEFSSPATAQQRAALHAIFGKQYDAVLEKIGGEDNLTKSKASQLIEQGKKKKEEMASA